MVGVQPDYVSVEEKRADGSMYSATLFAISLPCLTVTNSLRQGSKATRAGWFALLFCTQPWSASYDALARFYAPTPATLRADHPIRLIQPSAAWLRIVFAECR